VNNFQGLTLARVYSRQKVLYIENVIVRLFALFKAVCALFECLLELNRLFLFILRLFL